MTDHPATDRIFKDPICPNCRESLREAMSQTRVTPKTTDLSAFSLSVTVVFCGLCGFTLDVASALPMSAVLDARGMEPVTVPVDEDSLDSQFQIRCRDMVREVRSLGFNPNVWVSMINGTDAIGAAKKLLADRHVLVATPWLVERGRSELTHPEIPAHEVNLPPLSRQPPRTPLARRALHAGYNYGETTDAMPVFAGALNTPMVLSTMVYTPAMPPLGGNTLRSAFRPAITAV